MKKCVIVINTYKSESRSLGESVAGFLRERNVVCDFFTFDGFSKNVQFGDIDFMVTLGGDGTVLFAARCCADKGIPVFPINLGEFGFIASIEKNEWKEPLDKFLAGQMSEDSRSMLKVLVGNEKNPDFEGIALNDVVISAEHAVSTVSLGVLYDGISLGEFKADGIIISTATGSTAYSVSAGGPIIDPSVDVFVLTPINAFSLSGRPIVFAPKGKLEIVVLPSRTKEVILTVDGQKPVQVSEGEHIIIKKHEHSVKLVGCSPKKFYDALRSKLNWSGGPHARNPDD